MNKTIKKLIEQKDEDEYLYPDTLKLNKEDKSLIKEIGQILEHNRFCHEGWLNYGFYREEAAYFILKIIRDSLSNEK